MRRTSVLLAATALLILGVVAMASPAAASRPGGGLGPTAYLDCSASGGGAFWAQPARSGVPGWDYYSDSGKPTGVVAFGALFGNEPDTNLTLCSVHFPVIPGTDTYDSSWGIPEESGSSFFLFH